MPIDHFALHIAEDKFQDCLNLYLAALKPLGYEIRQQYGPTIVGLGSLDDVVADYKPADFWVFAAKEPTNTTHVAFRVKDRVTVDAFHAAALEAGGKDNGAPGVRSHSHPNYYGAYVLDAAGNNVEAVCHAPQ